MAGTLAEYLANRGSGGSTFNLTDLSEFDGSPNPAAPTTTITANGYTMQVYGAGYAGAVGYTYIGLEYGSSVFNYSNTLLSAWIAAPKPTMPPYSGVTSGSDIFSGQYFNAGPVCLNNAGTAEYEFNVPPPIGGTAAWTINPTDIFDLTLHHFLVSIDWVNGKLSAAIDGTLQTPLAIDMGGAVTGDTLSYSIAAASACGDWWFDTAASYIPLTSEIVRKFYNAGPVSPAADGSAPFGSAPLMFYSGSAFAPTGVTQRVLTAPEPFPLPCLPMCKPNLCCP